MNQRRDDELRTLRTRLATVRIMFETARSEETARPKAETRAAMAYWQKRIQQLQDEIDAFGGDDGD